MPFKNECFLLLKTLKLSYLLTLFGLIMMQNWNLIAGIGIISSPILFALIAFPDSFSLSWNQGRGGFLFALVFVVAELVGLKIVISKKRLVSVIPFAILTISYLVSLEFGLREYIVDSAEFFNIQLIYSWTWLWDFVVMALFLIVALTIFFWF